MWSWSSGWKGLETLSRKRKCHFENTALGSFHFAAGEMAFVGPVNALQNGLRAETPPDLEGDTEMSRPLPREYFSPGEAERGLSSE